MIWYVINKDSARLDGGNDEVVLRARAASTDQRRAVLGLNQTSTTQLHYISHALAQIWHCVNCESARGKAASAPVFRPFSYIVRLYR